MADTDPNAPTEAPGFETDTVRADRAREQGLGLGEREVQAQRDPGGVRTLNEDDADALDQSIGVQGEDDSQSERTANPEV
ncbi:MAG TPA: hypothetical protein VFF48_03950 [Brevundimonas sp.]|nr:hypothetical protein [Brevundimonas sp.]